MFFWGGTSRLKSSSETSQLFYQINEDKFPIDFCCYQDIHIDVPELNVMTFHVWIVKLKICNFDFSCHVNSENYCCLSMENLIFDHNLVFSSVI